MNALWRTNYSMFLCWITKSDNGYTIWLRYDNLKLYIPGNIYIYIYIAGNTTSLYNSTYRLVSKCANLAWICPCWMWNMIFCGIHHCHQYFYLLSIDCPTVCSGFQPRNNQYSHYQPFMSAHMSYNENAWHIIGIWRWKSPITGGFPSQMASNAESDSLSWRYHVSLMFLVGNHEKQRQMWTMAPGARFTDNFSLAIQTRWKFRLALTPVLATR